MVIEPELSTIAQSVAGSSPKPDLSPDDQLTEMRIPSEVVEQGYFGQTSSRESSLRSKSPDVGIVHPRQSRLGVPQSRLPRQNPSIFAGPAPTTPVDRKSLPSPSRVVSGDIPLYTASPSASRKGGSSRNMSADPVPSPRAHDSPSAALERSNSARAAIFPTRRRQPQREPINGAALKTPRDLRSQVNYVATSDDRSKQMGRNASANEVVRRSPDRHDPFGPIPRRRPASPPKPTSVLQPAGLETHFSLGTGPFTGNEPIRKIDAEPTQLHDGRHPPGAVPSAVEVEPREVEGSNDTIVRHNIAESVPEVVPEAEKFHAPTATNKDLNSSPSQVDPEHRSFLGIRPEGHPEEPVTATSFQSVSTNPALTHRQSHQSPRDTDQARPIKSIASMGELPPFVVKDPLTGTSQPITPSSPKVLSEAANASFKEKILEANERDVSTITTTTITATTGYDPGPFQLEQVDGGNDSRRPVQRRPMPLSRIPAPRLSPQSARNHSPSGLAQRRQTEKDTSSIGAAAVTPTKRRIPRWYQRVLPGFGREAEKNTHTSTSTSPNQTPTSPRYHLGYPGGHPGAQSAARAALLNGGPAPSHSPRTSSQRAGIGAGAPGGSLGGGDSWKSRTGNPVRDGHGDSLVVWHSAPATPLRRLKHSPGGIEKKHVAGIRSPNSTKREQNTTGGATMQQVILVLLRTIRQLILTAWWYVEPVFDPRSAFRGRWERQELTWRDAMVIAGACLFVAGALLAAVVCGRVVVTAVQIGRLVGGTCRFLLGG